MPALLGMALLQLALFGTAVPLMAARARGSLLHLSMTPVPVTAIVLSHVLVRLGIAAVQLVMLLVIAKLGFGLEIQGNPGLLLLSCLLGALMLIATGFLLGGIAPSQQAGNYMVMLVNFPMLFLGNIFFDTSGLGALDWLARLLPITYLSDLNRQLILGNDGRFSASLDWAVLAVSSILLIVLAVRTFRFSMDSRV
jgi:ABC-2 type transport system permease protein